MESSIQLPVGNQTRYLSLMYGAKSCMIMINLEKIMLKEKKHPRKNVNAGIPAMMRYLKMQSLYFHIVLNPEFGLSPPYLSLCICDLHFCFNFSKQRDMCTQKTYILFIQV